LKAKEITNNIAETLSKVKDKVAKGQKLPVIKLDIASFFRFVKAFRGSNEEHF
jgi:hypothetical protein